MKYTIALTLSLVPITAAAAAEDYSEWTYIGEDTDNTIVWVRTEDMLKGRPTSTKIAVWVKMDHSKDPTITFRESKKLFEINCPNQTYRKLTTTAYYPNGSTSSDTPAYAPIKYVVPGSTLEGVVKMVCSDPDATPE